GLALTLRLPHLDQLFADLVEWAQLARHALAHAHQMEPLARLDRSLPETGRELENPGGEFGSELVRHRPLVDVAKFGLAGNTVADVGDGHGPVRKFPQRLAGIRRRVG